MKLMVKLQRCSEPDKVELCLKVAKRVQALSCKGDKMLDAALSVIIPIQGRDNDLYSFLLIVREELDSFSKCWCAGMIC